MEAIGFSAPVRTKEPQLKGRRRTSIARAIGKRDWRSNVYNDEQDKYHLMHCIGEAHQQFESIIVAFCIMSNHFHILIKSKEKLSKIMARISRRCSDYYSNRYLHVGRIYQRRCFAKAIEDPHVLLIVSCYFHRNPLEAKIPMVIDLHHYPLSSYPSY